VFNKLGVSSRVEVVIYAASQKDGGRSVRKDGTMSTRRQKIRA
jgi:hypothetical protein